MYRKRFSKLLLVVLALALWAGAAYGQELNAGTTAWNATYAIGSEQTVQTTVGVTAVADGTGYTAASTVGWLTITGGTGTANIASGEQITVTVNPSLADALGLGPQSGAITLTANDNVSGNPDATVTVTILNVPLLPAASTVTLTYVKGGGSSQASANQTVGVTDLDSTPDDYTLSMGACPAYILASSAWGVTQSAPLTGEASSTAADSLKFWVDSTNSSVNGLAGGTTGSCAVTLSYTSTNFWTFTLNWTINNTASGSPLTLATPGTIALTYTKYGGVQASASSTATVDSSDTSADTMTTTVMGAPAPAWCAATPTTSFTTASISTPGKVTFSVVATAADLLTASTTPYTCTVDVNVSGQPAFAVSVTLTVSAQTLSFTTSSVSLAYTTGASATGITNTVVAKDTGGSVTFASDGATLPWWLNAVTGTATVAGSTTTLTANSAVLTGMSVGNYSASVGFKATNLAATAVVAEFYLTVNLSISATAGTISMGTSPAAVILQPGATTPTPTVTAVASIGEIGFTATCSATTSYTLYTPTGTGCTLKNGANPSAASVTGIAYTWGTGLAVNLDSGMFSGSTPFGTQVLATITITTTSNGSSAPSPMVYTYNFNPVPATVTSPLSPASTIEGGTNPVVVTITGTNFVPPSMIIGSSLNASEVFISTTASVAGVISAWTQVTSNVVVVNPPTIVVTIPAASLPTFTPSPTLSTAKLYIGVANQTTAVVLNPATGGFQPDGHASLDVTTNPVIYAVTSTASYLQPNPGTLQTVVPYELVSIFGANFGASGNVVGTPDATYSKYPTALTVASVTSGKTTTNTILKETFTGSVGVGSAAKATTYSAPILFANADQINIVVPSGLNAGTVQVAVSSGSTATPPASDNFPGTYGTAAPGIFTLTSSGTGQGAILNPNGVVNGPGAGAVQGVDTIAIYMTGLGAPNSVAADATSNTITSGTGYPGNCVSLSSYLTLVNTSVTTGTHYTAPTPAWTGLEGALMTRVLAGLPPCMVSSGTTAVTVSFNGGTAQAATYAGFVSSSVAGLYQVNVPVPSGLITSGTSLVTFPLTVTINGIASPPVNVVVHP